MSTYTIPTTQREAVEKAVARIQKKASKYGKQFVVEYGEVKAVEVPVRAVDEINNCIVNKGTELVEVFDLTIEGEIIRKDGYTVIAQIEHFEEGNVLVWFASGVFGHWAEDENHTMRFIEEQNVTRIKATVKDHNERDGVKQTIINRVKVA